MGRVKELLIEIEDEMANGCDEHDAEAVAKINLARRRLGEAVMILAGGKETFDASNLPVSEAIQCVRSSIESDSQLLGSLLEITAKAGRALKASGF
jgi:hypothetical protein